MSGNPVRSIVIIAAAVTTLLAATSFAQQSPFGGAASPDTTVDKVVRIDAKTRWVNITQDDTVRFVVSGPGGEKTFAWQFQTQHNAVRLNDIAPAGTFDRVILVYLAPNPRRGCSG